MLVGQAIILGIIQGFTEFLPISSSGHLIIVPFLFNWTDQGLLFDAVLHLGTLLAVFVYFRKEVHALCIGFLNRKNHPLFKRTWQRLSWYIIIATVPAALFAFVFGSIIESVARVPLVVAISLIGWGLVLLWADIYSRRFEYRAQKEVDRVSLWTALAVGLWQVLALIPGTSRSGITITGGIFAGMSKQVAIRFSFLLSLPVIAAAGLFSLVELIAAPQVSVDFWLLFVGLISSAISGYIAIALLLKLVEKVGLIPFVIYRILLALLLLFFIV